MAHMDRFTRFVCIYLFSKCKGGVSDCVARDECVAREGVQKGGGSVPVQIGLLSALVRYTVC